MRPVLEKDDWLEPPVKDDGHPCRGAAWPIVLTGECRPHRYP